MCLYRLVDLDWSFKMYQFGKALFLTWCSPDTGLVLHCCVEAVGVFFIFSSSLGVKPYARKIKFVSGPVLIGFQRSEECIVGRGRDTDLAPKPTDGTANPIQLHRFSTGKVMDHGSNHRSGEIIDLF